MTGFEIAALVMSGVAILGLMGTWIKNGKSQVRRDKEAAVKQAERDQKLASNQISIIKTLDDDESGLSAINKRMRSFELNCKGISTGLSTRVKMAEDDITEIKIKPRHHKQ